MARFFINPYGILEINYDPGIRRSLWDLHTQFGGAIDPDEFAATRWLQHMQQYGVPYQRGTNIELLRVRLMEDYLNQPSLRAQRGGRVVDLQNDPNIAPIIADSGGQAMARDQDTDSFWENYGTAIIAFASLAVMGAVSAYLAPAAAASESAAVSVAASAGEGAASTALWSAEVAAQGTIVDGALVLPAGAVTYPTTGAFVQGVWVTETVLTPSILGGAFAVPVAAAIATMPAASAITTTQASQPFPPSQAASSIPTAAQVGSAISTASTLQKLIGGANPPKPAPLPLGTQSGTPGAPTLPPGSAPKRELTFAEVIAIISLLVAVGS